MLSYAVFYTVAAALAWAAQGAANLEVGAVLRAGKCTWHSLPKPQGGSGANRTWDGITFVDDPVTGHRAWDYGFLPNVTTALAGGTPPANMSNFVMMGVDACGVEYRVLAPHPYKGLCRKDSVVCMCHYEISDTCLGFDKRGNVTWRSWVVVRGSGAAHSTAHQHNFHRDSSSYPSVRATHGRAPGSCGTGCPNGCTVDVRYTCDAEGTSVTWGHCDEGAPASLCRQCLVVATPFACNYTLPNSNSATSVFDAGANGEGGRGDHCIPTCDSGIRWEIAGPIFGGCFIVLVALVACGVKYAQSKSRTRHYTRAATVPGEAVGDGTAVEMTESQDGAQQETPREEGGSVISVTPRLKAVVPAAK